MDHHDTEQDIQVQFGRNLKVARLGVGLTQQEVAAVAGVAPTFLAEIERGAGDPDLRLAEALSDAVGCSIIDLLKP